LSATADIQEPGPVWICPVCRKPLLIREGSFQCINRHSYDISSYGYVNLLLANRKHSRVPGDSKEMTAARKKFLSSGYYSPLAGKITEIIQKRVDQKRSLPLIILDAGCGEGYYLHYISGNDIINRSSVLCGIDVSKHAVKSASGKNRNIHFAVGNIFDLPVPDKSADILINIFSPFSEPELNRVLADNGIIISVTPGSHHLEGLKKILYEEPHLHDEDYTGPDSPVESYTEKLSYEIELNDREAVLPSENDTLIS